MTNSEIIDVLNDMSIRLDRIIWLGGATEGFSDSDIFDELDPADKHHPSMAKLLACPSECWVDEVEWLEWLRAQGLNGFLVTAATPKPTKVYSDGGYSTNGWGYQQLVLLYVEDVKDAVLLALEWQAGLVLAQLAKQNAAVPE